MITPPLALHIARTSQCRRQLPARLTLRQFHRWMMRGLTVWQWNALGGGIVLFVAAVRIWEEL